ncbi:hypothetical protein L5515_016704 [Caenorhabditis briggsae]|uniref:Uncharacterized protein n=1 Tax=Caenorhabditis briggsae TaxID=6238 RepID=A0AAE9FCC1_CAEBR|nr:hypothetical protein L5515_016704 [Caenorhabditis briggsae]
MPNTAKEAVERYEEMFEGKRIISERFDIQCFLFDKTKPAEEKDGKWVQRKVLKRMADEKSFRNDELEQLLEAYIK